MGKHRQKDTPGWVNQEAALSLLDTSKRTLGRMVKAGDVRKSLVEGRACYSIESINKLIANKTGLSVAPTPESTPLFSPESMEKLRGYWNDEPNERGVLLAIEMGARMYAIQREIGKTLTADMMREALAAQKELATRVTIPKHEQAGWEDYQQRGQDALFNNGHLEEVKRLVAEGEISGFAAVQRVGALRDEVENLRPLRRYVTKLASEARDAEEKHCGEVAILQKVAATLQQQHETELQEQADAHSRALEDAAGGAAADKDAAVWGALQEAKADADADKAAAVEATQLIAVMERGAAVQKATREAFERMITAERQAQIAESEAQKCFAEMDEQQEDCNQRVCDLRASLEAEHAEVVDAGAERERVLQETLDAREVVLQTDLGQARADRDTHQDAGRRQFLWRNMLNTVLQRAGLPNADTVCTWLDKYGEEFERDFLPLLKQEMQRYLLARKGGEGFLVESRTIKAGNSLLELLSSANVDNSRKKSGQ